MDVGNVFCWGFGKEGEIGIDCSSVSLPKQISKKGGVLFVTCGTHCTFCIMNNGKVYGWGKTSNGRLGIQNSNATSIRKPTLLKPLNNIIKISCGEWHSLALSSQGQIVGWGKNHCGQLGNNDCKKIFPIHQIDITKIINDFSQGIIKNIACGQNFSFLLFENGKLYSSGNNSSGQLGNGSLNHSFEFRCVEIPENVKIISCGSTHVGILTDSNQLYMWGSNKYGELGNSMKSKNSIVNPTKVEFFNETQVIDISCSISVNYPHTLAITENNDHGKKLAWAWGCNYKSKLGINETGKPVFPDDSGSYFSTPQLIPYFDGRNVIKVIAGGIHSLALCDDQIYSWGCGSDGRLGHPESDNHRYLFKEIFPRRIDALLEYNVIDISASYYHSACVAFPNISKTRSQLFI